MSIQVVLAGRVGAQKAQGPGKFSIELAEIGYSHRHRGTLLCQKVADRWHNICAAGARLRSGRPILPIGKSVRIRDSRHATGKHSSGGNRRSKLSSVPCPWNGCASELDERPATPMMLSSLCLKCVFHVDLPLTVCKLGLQLDLIIRS